MLRRAFLASTAAVLGAGPMLSTSWGQTAPVQKVAFLVGVSKYKKDGFDNLDYCVRDINELAAELRKHEFKVATLTGDEATKEAVDAWLAKVFESLAKLEKQDVALLGFSGHGVQSLVKNPNPGQPDIEDAFFCPADALKSRTDTMISISRVMRQLDELSGSSQNLVLVDACRNNPNKGAKNIDGSTAKELPSKISVLFSSSAGKRSYESHEVKHGVFTHVLLQGLRGGAANRNGQITWLTLASYAIDEVPQQTRKLLDDPQAEQEPNLLGNLVRQPVLARIDARTNPGKPPMVRPALLRAPFTPTEAGRTQQAWADYLGVPKTKRDPASGLAFTLIPPGEFTMGSSPAERAQMLQLYATAKAEYFADEKSHSVRITQPFYLGIHEVTVGQFRRFVTATSHKTEAEKDGQGGWGWNEVDGKFEGRKPQYTWRNTGFSQSDEHPVVNVSWNDAAAYCEWLGSQDGATYRLPREAEWEYACRAGTTTAFWNGDDVEAVVAVGNLADSSAKAKWKNIQSFTYQKRSDGFVFTAPVGSYSANPFGLYDMHGNVYEWCQDWYDAEYYSSSPMDDPVNVREAEYRVLRGGSWYGYAWGSRSADRSRYAPAFRVNYCGLRVLCLLR
jgi:formylglycine-generating enzyme required for sulfatase activity